MKIIYSIRDADGIVKYIGRTGNLRGRKYKYISEIKNNNGSPIVNWMRENDYYFKEEVYVEDQVAAQVELDVSLEYNKYHPLLNINFGNKHSKSTKDKIKIGNLGKKYSNSTKAKMSAKAKLRPNITCPHCGKEGDMRNMKRWHFDNCRLIDER